MVTSFFKETSYMLLKAAFILIKQYGKNSNIVKYYYKLKYLFCILNIF